MRFTRNLSFEHQAVKNRRGEKDLTEKFKIIGWIYEKMGLIGLTGETIVIPDHPKNRCRFPDIVIPQKNIVIELDGGVHGSGDDISKREKDKDRDNDYKEAGYKLVIINEEKTDGYSENLVMIEMEKQLK